MGSPLIANELTDAELSLIEALPGPPAVASVRTTNVWIVEWLSPEERHTGRELHEWMEGRRPGWSNYHCCNSKGDVIQSIERARLHAQCYGSSPVLHLEAHGCDIGLARSSSENADFLYWDELVGPLQQLNLATQCNLIVVVAACVGFAAVQSFRQGPCAPAVAFVGPDANLPASNLLAGTKELYRRWSDDNPTLTDIAESASRETGAAHFECEPFATLFYEAMVESLVKSIRPAERLARIHRLRQRMLAETKLSPSEIDIRLAQLPSVSRWEDLQVVWDQMFLVDINPDNRQRFGIDMKAIVQRIEESVRIGQV